MATTWEPADEDATLIGDDPGASRTHVEDAARLARGDVIGRYVVLGSLGAGGMGAAKPIASGCFARRRRWPESPTPT